jgi:nitrogenase subunit NifH
VLDQGKFIGYVHQYGWDDKKGNSIESYAIFNTDGDVLGYVRNDGQTVKYRPDGTLQELGNFSLNRALESIFSKAIAIQVIEFHKDEEYVAWTKKEKETLVARTKDLSKDHHFAKLEEKKIIAKEENFSQNFALAREEILAKPEEMEENEEIKNYAKNLEAKEETENKEISGQKKLAKPEKKLESWPDKWME